MRTAHPVKTQPVRTDPNTEPPVPVNQRMDEMARQLAEALTAATAPVEARITAMQDEMDETVTILSDAVETSLTAEAGTPERQAVLERVREIRARVKGGRP